MVFVLISCSSSKPSDKWDVAEMGGVADPGFSVVSKSKTNQEIKYLFKNVELTKVNMFLEVLYASEFKEDVNYNYTENFYIYSAFNLSGKCIDFEYNVVEKTASFTYSLSGKSAYASGVLDMGYYIKVNFEKDADSDYKNYTVWLYYSINPEVSLTSQNDTAISCMLKDIKIKNSSSVGSLSIVKGVFDDDSIVEVNCLKQGFLDPYFIVRQNGIGKLPANFSFTAENQKPVFDAMAIGAADLNFVITFTAEIVTNKGTYTKEYEISVLPSGSDVTGMKNSTYVVDKIIKELSKGTPYLKQ